MAAVKEVLTKKGSRKRLDPRLELLTKLLAFDSDIKSEFADSILIGIDEVGRGCLAGPVVAGAVVLPEIDLESSLAQSLGELNDSKQLKAEQRAALSLILQEHTLHSIGSATVEEIDRLNIYHASLLAMQRAVSEIIYKLSYSTKQIVVLVDGKAKIPKLNYPQKCIIKGDGLSASIAAASIIAKVHRDQMMINLAQEHPNYHWHSNKGYASRRHREAIVTYGINAWHRRAFVVKVLQTSEQLDLDLKFEQVSH
jgi:ribonuclease HII